MGIQALIPYALGAIGAYQGYQSAKDSGASGLGRLFSAGLGGFGGYSLGGSLAGLFPGAASSQIPRLASSSVAGAQFRDPGLQRALFNEAAKKSAEKSAGGSGIEKVFDFFKKGDGSGDIDPFKASTALGAGLYFSGAFDQKPTDIYTPGYNMGYLQLRDQRPGYSYIDPETGQEKQYERVYAPEEQGLGDRRIGNYSLNVARLNTGGLATIKKFNEGGVNYLPSKVSHDENDSNNYVRAAGYVEDGSGAGDKDEDTMLAQLADGEFVTRADGVLGAGIIAGGNPNSIKDMREKGAAYFYEQQKRYKRVFDLLKEKDGNTQQKTN